MADEYDAPRRKSPREPRGTTRQPAGGEPGDGRESRRQKPPAEDPAARTEPARARETRRDPKGRRDPAARGEPADAYAGTFAAALRRVSWGAIFAGAVVALVLQLMLNLLGLSIGLGAIDPAAQQDPLGGLGTGAGIWLVVTGLIALFAGGWTAGRLAGLPRPIDGVLHGFVAWAVATFVTFYLVVSGVGTVLSGAFTVVQEGTRVVAQGVEAVAPQAGEAVGAIGDEISTEEVRQEALTILQQTGQEELQPENLAQRADAAAGTAGEAAGEAAQSPAEAEQEIQQALDQLITSGQEVVDEVDREAAVNVLVNRTDMTEEEARSTVVEYEQVFRQARQQIEQTAQQVQEQAPQVASDVTDAVSRAALWGFITMLIGALAAAGGGAIGAPQHVAAPAERRRY